jgi:hypothetical protein
LLLCPAGARKTIAQAMGRCVNHWAKRRAVNLRPATHIRIPFHFQAMGIRASGVSQFCDISLALWASAWRLDDFSIGVGFASRRLL